MGSLYRAAGLFSNLKIYINSITKQLNGEISITYPKNWEYQIYKTGLINDSIGTPPTVPTLVIGTIVSPWPPSTIHVTS